MYLGIFLLGFGAIDWVNYIGCGLVVVRDRLLSLLHICPLVQLKLQCVVFLQTNSITADL